MTILLIVIIQIEWRLQLIPNFYLEKKNLKDIGAAYLKVDVVILNGSAGTGKTRLTLHYFLKNHPDAINEKVYCIHSNALPIYEDLKIFIDRPETIFLLLMMQINCQDYSILFVMLYETRKDIT